MYCSQCGCSLPEGAAFCGSCGNRIGGAPAQDQPAAAASTSQAPQPDYSAPKQGYSAPQQNYSAPQQNYTAAPAPYAGGPIQTDRNLAVYIILSIVTCGIYSYYWIYKLAKDVNRMCDGDGSNTGGLAAFILLSFITCGLYSFYWDYKIQERMVNNAPRYGVTITESATNILVLTILGYVTCYITTFIAIHFLMKSANTLAEAYNAQLYPASAN